MEKQRTYIAIDLKSFYASVECVERGLDPLRTNLVVADPTRTEKTICLAVTPSLKAYGIGGRARLFEVVQRVREVNLERLCFSPDGVFHGRSTDSIELRGNSSLELDYIVAPPRMRLYVQYSRRIYQIYLRHIAPDDIYPYSIDEVFIDATNYLEIKGVTPRQMASMLVSDVLSETGITATAGIGTNIYLAKVAMDIEAKHAEPDANGVRIAELDELSFRHKLWGHRPLSDFWQVGRATQRKLEANGMMTMGDVARRSLTDENLLYNLFGIHAELLIDHAWGWEPVGLEQIGKIKPQSRSFSSGQVLKEPYPVAKARIVVREMADNIALKLVRKGMLASQMALYIGYDTANIKEGGEEEFGGQIAIDYYGREVPVPAHANVKLTRPTDSSNIITKAIVKLFDSIVDTRLRVRRLNIAACDIIPNSGIEKGVEQLNLFDDQNEVEQRLAKRKAEQERDARVQHASLIIKERFGSNFILSGTNFEEDATARERNGQMGGHKL